MTKYACLFAILILGCSDAGSRSGGGDDDDDTPTPGPGAGGGGQGGSADGGVPSLPENEWTQIDFPSTADVFCVWAEAANKVWIGADDGLYRSDDGMTLTKVDLGMPLSIRDMNPDVFLAPFARAAGSSGASRVVLEHDPQSGAWAPFAWDPGYGLSQSGAPIGRISSAGETFWIAALDGSVVGVFDPEALFGSPNLYDAKMGELVSYSADTFAVAGPFSNRAYAGGSRGIFRWGGATSGPDNWTKQTEDFPIRDFFYDGATADVWAVGEGIYRYDGTSAWALAAPGSWRSIQKIGGELWVAGDGSVARSADMSSFSTIAVSPGSQLNDVSGVSPDDVWAVGNGGEVWRCVGPLCSGAAN